MPHLTGGVRTPWILGRFILLLCALPDSDSETAAPGDKAQSKGRTWADAPDAEPALGSGLPQHHYAAHAAEADWSSKGTNGSCTASTAKYTLENSHKSPFAGTRAALTSMLASWPKEACIWDVVHPTGVRIRSRPSIDAPVVGVIRSGSAVHAAPAEGSHSWCPMSGTLCARCTSVKLQGVLLTRDRRLPFFDSAVRRRMASLG